MPELPEVETVRLGLQKHILNKQIKQIKVNWPGVIKTKQQKFAKIVVGDKIKNIARVGKLLIFELKNSSDVVLVHLKMTGQLIYQAGKHLVAGGHKLTEADLVLPNKYSWLIIKFKDNSQLFFNDMRKFGYIKLVDQQTRKKIESQFGPEPLQAQFTLKKFKEILQNRKTNIKAILLNQKLIAGIGNIYADEICFLAQVHPAQVVNNLTEKQTKQLHRACKNILSQAIKYGGTTFRDFADVQGRKGNYSDKLKVYGRTNQLCLKCKQAKIKKIKVAGRGTHYCPTCQTIN